MPPEAIAATCSFCDSPLVDDERASEPVDRLVRFEVPRDRAARLLGRHLQRQWLAPEALRRAARPDELRAVYVPFYAFDATSRTRYRARIGIYWMRTETYTEVENGRPVTKTRQVRETDWHPLQGTHVGQWFAHLVSASRGLPEAEANALEPFDVGASVPWAPALVAGLQAEVPTISRLDAEQTAVQELRERAAAAVERRFLPGDVQREVSCDTAATLDDVELVMLPVWVAVFTGPKGPVRLLVNGQTAEVVGRVPKSARKLVAIAVAAVFTAMFGLLTATCFGGGS